MKKFGLGITLAVILFVSACKQKKYSEVVEVPLPTKEQKVTLGDPDAVKANEGAFELMQLPFKYDALQPNIDAYTLEIHYSNHYLGYTNKLNELLAGSELEALPLTDIFKKLDRSDEELRNNLGGYYNHSLYFELLTPKAQKKPSDTLAAALEKDFGSFENFKTEFKAAANKQFGSGWTWLIVDQSGKLQITSTPNQDNPLMQGATVSGTPILGIDVWEHAYYLDYQYKRKKYIDNFFNCINWEKVAYKYEEAIAK